MKLEDIFVIRRKPKPKLRRYTVTWPCGSTWPLDRTDLEVPEYKDGEQTGMTLCFDTLREAIDILRHDYGCKVEKEG